MESSPALTRAARLDAVRGIDVGPEPDPDLERFARLTASVLRSPIALVAIVEADRQIFPGQLGLPEPLASQRQAPLAHSLCQFVTASRTPLVVPDTTVGEYAALGVARYGVRAYAGVPLTDENGEVFGSLCAVDREVREWDEADLALLTDLAESCSAELRMRIAARKAAASRAELERSYQRAELLLRAAEVLGDARDLADLRTRVRELVTGPLEPIYVGLSLVTDDELHRVPDPDHDYDVETRFGSYHLDDAWPTSRCIALQRTITVEDRDQLAADGYSDDAVNAWQGLGIGALVCKPLMGTQRILGSLAFGWATPHATEVTEDAVLTAIAGYTATAVERVLALDHRISAAIELQRAMLSRPIEIPGLEIATLYRPASSADMVGGDWYDVHRLPDPRGLRVVTDADHDAGAVVVTVGDITGHDMRAAAIMGQARSMLRQAGIDEPAHSPARALEAVSRAAEVLELDLSGTVVHGHLRPQEAGWELVWTNAGHPSPLVIGPDGGATLLDDNDVLLIPGLDLGPRTDHRVRLAPGSLLLIYTDGLLDDRRVDHDAMVAEVGATLAQLLAEDLSLQEMVSRCADRMVGTRSDDDVAILAVRVS